MSILLNEILVFIAMRTYCTKRTT